MIPATDRNGPAEDRNPTRSAVRSIAALSASPRSSALGSGNVASVTVSRWGKTRAGRYRDQLGEAVARARRAGVELDELAAALDEHARVVERELAVIAAAEQWLKATALGAVQDAQHEARQAANWVVRQGANVVHGVEDGVSSAVHGAQAAASETVRRADELRRSVEDIVPGSVSWVERARAQGWTG